MPFILPPPPPLPPVALSALSPPPLPPPIAVKPRAEESSPEVTTSDMLPPIQPSPTVIVKFVCEVIFVFPARTPPPPPPAHGPPAPPPATIKYSTFV